MTALGRQRGRGIATLANVGAAWIVINATPGPAATDGAVAIKKEWFHECLDQQPRQDGPYAFEMTGLADLTYWMDWFASSGDLLFYAERRWDAAKRRPSCSSQGR